MGSMMAPIRTEHTTTILGAPKDWDEAKDGKCVGLPVHKDTATNCFYSFWQPSEEDISNILAGVPIRLTVVGFTHPPVAIGVSNSVK